MKTALSFILCLSMMVVTVRAEVDPLLIKLNCQICHHPAVVSTSLEKKSPRQVLSDLQQFKTGKRASLIMHRLVKGLTDKELKQVATMIGRRYGDQ